MRGAFVVRWALDSTPPRSSPRAVAPRLPARSRQRCHEHAHRIPDRAARTRSLQAQRSSAGRPDEPGQVQSERQPSGPSPLSRPVSTISRSPGIGGRIGASTRSASTGPSRPSIRSKLGAANQPLALARTRSTEPALRHPQPHSRWIDLQLGRDLCQRQHGSSVCVAGSVSVDRLLTAQEIAERRGVNTQ